MKNASITKIEIYKLNIPLNEPFKISLGEVIAAHNIVIKIHTDIGLTGVGECSAIPYIAGETQESQFEVAKKFATLLKSKDPFALEDRLGEMNRALAGNYTLKSAFDMALYDLLAKQAGLPLYRLLGGSNSRDIHTDMTIGLDTAERMAAKAVAHKEERFSVLKVKLGTTPEDDIARVKAIREAVGFEIAIRVDANQGWDPVTAIQILNALEPFNIEHCEEPVPHWDNRGLTKVRKNSPIPIMADESAFDHRDAFRLASMGACDLINVKLAKSGGIHTALKMIAVAEACGMKCQVGCMQETRYALTALTHLAAARPAIVYFDIDTSFFQASDPVVGGIEYQGAGRWKLPQTPGIGADFDQEFLDKMEKVVV